MSFLRDMVTRVFGEPVEGMQATVVVDPDDSTRIMHVNADGSLNVDIASGEATSTAINDGTTTSQKAAVSAGGALKVDGSAVTQPVSATSLPLPTGAATSANQSTQVTSLSNIDTSTSASKTDLDAINTILGAAGDSNSTNTHMGRLTKIRDYLAGLVYDNTDRLKVSLYGKNAAAADTALLVNSDGSVQYDLRKVAGSVLSASNPLITETNINNWIRNANSFVAYETMSTATTAGLSIYNPSLSKTILITRVTGGNGTAGSLLKTYFKTSDFAFGSSATAGPTNKSAGGAASAATVSAAASGLSTSGTGLTYALVVGNTPYELITTPFVLPAGANNAFAVFNTSGGATSGWVLIEWIEF